MTDSTYIRPLQLSDALVSYKWRNNPRIWQFTGGKPDKVITPEMETEWLDAVLKRPNERRYAICDTPTNKYIGNIYLTDINGQEAHLHIFIGEIEYWGSGRAASASNLLAREAFTKLGLTTILALVKKDNRSAIALSRVCGYRLVEEFYSEEYSCQMLRLEYTIDMYHRDIAKKETGQVKTT